MRQRKWAADEKLAMVMEGLKEKKSVADICREHKVSQTLYYKWRDKFLEGGRKALAYHLRQNVSIFLKSFRQR